MTALKRYNVKKINQNGYDLLEQIAKELEPKRKAQAQAWAHRNKGERGNGKGSEMIHEPYKFRRPACTSNNDIWAT